MTTILTLVDALRKAQEIDDPIRAYENNELGFLKDVKDELEDCSEVAVKTILASVPEERLVKLMAIVQKTTVALAATSGATTVLMCDLTGELQAYTQSVILCTIGALIKDEIL